MSPHTYVGECRGGPYVGRRLAAKVGAVFIHCVSNSDDLIVAGEYLWRDDHWDWRGPDVTVLR